MSSRNADIIHIYFIDDHNIETRSLVIKKKTQINGPLKQNN